MTQNNTELDSSRRSVLKTISGTTVAISSMSGLTAAAPAEQEEPMVNLVEVTLFGELETADENQIERPFIDDYHPYRANAEEQHLVVGSEETADRLSSKKTNVSVMNTGGEPFGSVSEPVSIPDQKGIPVKLTGGSPVEAVIAEESRGFGNVHLSGTGDDAISVRYRGSKATVEAGSKKVVRKSPSEISVRSVSPASEYERATVTPALQVMNYGPLSIHVI